MDQMEFRKPQDGAYSQEIMGRMFDLRVATFPLNAGMEKIVIRLLDPDKAAKHLSDLGISETGDWRAACGYPHGLVIVAGKTNSGKSTTLISSLREQDRIGKSIYTIEDPIEHRVDFITQMAVNRADSVRLDFQAGTRAMMRGDPEIILIGEIRDSETAHAAVQAAESGHLVFSTLHAGTVRESVSRLKSFGIDDATLRPMLRGVLAQRLIRTLCGFCRGKGCGPCMMTGYDNMTVVSEMGFFPSEGHFRRMVDDGEVFWKPMVRDALAKLEAGITDEREIYRVFRSEIDYLSVDYEGVQELADRVKAVVHHGKESMVDTTPTRQMTPDVEEKLEAFTQLEKGLSKLSINTPRPIDPDFDTGGSADHYGG
jgi:general secretion pathway protein E